jgi:CRP-like cAMP-binding protein
MIETATPQQNHLLAALPVEVKRRIFPHLKWVPLPLGLVLYAPGDVLSHVYFPIDAFISLFYVMENGDLANIALVGNDGLLGISLFMGGESAPRHAVVQSSGEGFRLESACMKAELDLHGELFNMALLYTQARMTQMAQTAVCNRHHNINQRLCRWLLLSLDRLPGNQFTMTHEHIANMLGVRREGVTEAAGKLQKLGVIEYHRGHINVLDRAKLERLSCECYTVVRKEVDRLLHQEPLRQAG